MLREVVLVRGYRNFDGQATNRLPAFDAHRSRQSMGASARTGSPILYPQDLLSSLYEVVLFGSRPTTYYAPFFSDRLTALLSSGILGPEEFRTLGFDPLTGFTGATLVTVFNLETMRQGPLTAEAIARFNADDVPVTITFSLVREAAEGWQVDDLQGTSGDREWTLSDLIDAVRAEDQ